LDSEQDISAVNGGIGNFDECDQIQGATLCLAGSISLNAPFSAPAPFAGVCVPQNCTSADLQNPKLAVYLSTLLDQRLLPALVQKTAEYPFHFNASTPASQLALDALLSNHITRYTSSTLEFFRNLRDTCIVTAEKSQGFTCGSWEPSIWDSPLGVVLVAFIALMTAMVSRNTWVDLKKERSVSGRWREPLNMIPSRKNSEVSLSSSDGTIPFTPEAEIYDKNTPKAVKAFSFARNLNSLFTVRHRNPGLGTFDGLRVISMLWVILGHTLAIMASVGFVNPWALLPPGGMLGQWIGQLFFSARFAVDTFFFMSGFLVVYVMLRRFEDKAVKQGVAKTSPGFISWLPFFYIHRYLRIVPLYAFLMLCWWKLAIYLGNGPFWFRWMGFQEMCNHSWWTNLLFVNNIVPWGVCESGGCLYVSWYLADDMQFYILSPLFFTLYYYRNLTGMTVTLVVCVAMIILTVKQTIDGPWSDLTFDGELVTNFSHYGYTVPWVKAPPYLIGMWTGMFWHRKEKKWPDWRFSRCHARVAMFMALILLYSMMFIAISGYQQRPCAVDEVPKAGKCGSAWPEWAILAHTCLSRPAWAAGLSLLSIVCFLGQGGIIQSILAHPAWVPLSRLTFGVYLIHPIVLNVWFFRQTEKYRYSGFDLGMTYICVVFVSFVLSLLATAIIEQPAASFIKNFENWLEPLIKAASNELENKKLKAPKNGRDSEDIPVRRTEMTTLLDPASHSSV